MLVTFGDLADPRSLREVDPANLAASFGKGFTLKSISVQMTDDVWQGPVHDRLFMRATVSMGPSIRHSSPLEERLEFFNPYRLTPFNDRK